MQIQETTGATLLTIKEEGVLKIRGSRTAVAEAEAAVKKVPYHSPTLLTSPHTMPRDTGVMSLPTSLPRRPWMVTTMAAPCW